MAILRSLIESASWIIDGNGLESLERRYSQADLVLYFNYPRWICYFRVLKRFLHKNPEIKDRAEGCKETLCFRLLHYMWNFENRVADQIKNFQARYPNTKFIEIKSDEDLEKLEDETLKA